MESNNVKHNMESKFTWMVLFLLSFIPCIITTGHGMTISTERMTWLDSFSNCSLASEDSLKYLNKGEYNLKGWAGGIYLNTQWRTHQGCYRKNGSMNSDGVYDIKRLTPTLCSEKCKMKPYFALKYNWCVCLNSLYSLEDVDSSKCTYKCLGSNNDVCGERSHFTVYKHITGEKKPQSDVDQTLACSVVMPRRHNQFLLISVNCLSKYWTACQISGVTRPSEFMDTYSSAISRCSKLNGTILSIYDNLDDLVDRREYWSDIYRFKFLKWITNESFDDVCFEVDGLLNVDCLVLEMKYTKARYLPIPCKHPMQAICKYKKHGVSAVNRQCQTKTSTTTNIKKETIPEYSNIWSTESALRPTHPSTKIVVLTSSLTTMSTVSTISHSIATKSVKTTFPKAMSTYFVSTNLDYTDSFTKEHSSVWSKSVPVSVSSSLSSINDTTIGTHTELTTLVAQINNDNRTVANETINNGLVYSALFSLVPLFAAVIVLIIIVVLIIVRKRQGRRKAHLENNGLQIELGALQPIVEYKKKSYDNQRNYLKTQDRGNPDCQIYDKTNDQYQHLDFDGRSKEPTCFEAEYDFAIATTSFLKPDQKNPSSNSAFKIAMAKRAQMLRTSLHFLQGQFSKQKSEKENVAYCDTAIVHTKFLYDTPQQSIKHVNKP